MAENDNYNSLGLRWTPYARAIAARYKTQVPFFLSVNTELTAAGQSRVALTDPYQYDCLLLGAHVDIGSDATPSDNGQQTFLQVSDERSGLLWVTPGFPDAAPATAFGGSQIELMPVQNLPEAFFLPAHVSLRLNWQSLSLATSGGSITWVGVQLIDPFDGAAPECVTLEDGSVVRVGSRLPWFATLGMGTEAQSGGLPVYTLVDDVEYQRFTPPMGCDVEVHSIHCNFFSAAGVSLSPNSVRVTIADEGNRRMHGLNQAPITAVFGSFEQVYPSLPLTRPYLLEAGRRLRINVFNESGADISEPYVTVRGVQLCEY